MLLGISYPWAERGHSEQNRISDPQLVEVENTSFCNNKINCVFYKL